MWYLEPSIQKENIQKEVSNVGCPSHGREPVNCIEKKTI